MTVCDQIWPIRDNTKTWKNFLILTWHYWIPTGPVGLLNNQVNKFIKGN